MKFNAIWKIILILIYFFYIIIRIYILNTVKSLILILGEITIVSNLRSIRGNILPNRDSIKLHSGKNTPESMLSLSNSRIPKEK